MIHAKGLYLVQQLSSEIKLRIHTAPGTTIYPNISPSWTWSRITERDPDPNNSSDQGKTGVRIGCEDWTWGSAGHVTFGREVLGILVGWEMHGRGGSGCRGLSWAVVDDPSHTQAR